MKNRILKFLSSENKTSAQFAEEIGVQPSSVSHILSGRNNPSLDFVLKMFLKYPYLSTEWLLFGKEPMYKEVHEPTLHEPNLFDNAFRGDDMDLFSSANRASSADQTTENKPQVDYEPLNASKGESASHNKQIQQGNRTIERIMIFYTDKTFGVYHPEG